MNLPGKSMNVADNDCIFCKIIAGKAESSRVYEDDSVLAFMDIQPVVDGQVLVIPKVHIDHFIDVPDDLAVRMVLIARRISKAVQNKFLPLRMGLIVHGFGVQHAHLIIVPEHDSQDITSQRMLRIVNGEVSFSISHLRKPARAELDKIADELAKSVSG